MGILCYWTVKYGADHFDSKTYLKSHILILFLASLITAVKISGLAGEHIGTKKDNEGNEFCVPIVD
eukprot:CAMPEP_0114584664 /NCGR_PEP_ID=MMETSP0125-20121206/8329_1 /TAXON_ID=485358 ORGANISM="Aristerostoma sp., Strain ATCC 50986" /NCGR_SAMPLE_ID=MMETSP0125 /ASSEMBLY_ACC=CAM_ASM_000245 /LENGTH=65 /DNA_ID=CAMNT_0001779211 /DNA_START=266 /DNA_END=463 /DNA_ORIENTATION=-